VTRPKLRESNPSACKTTRHLANAVQYHWQYPPKRSPTVQHFMGTYSRNELGAHEYLGNCTHSGKSKAWGFLTHARKQQVPFDFAQGFGETTGPSTPQIIAFAMISSGRDDRVDKI